ncbi:putative DNA binding domain-containing protein [Phototrophicus methaneseepsis]|uniref:Putative DNA binding domain-containing protein n=1 Tax=Phototrophicus methaneseepsis TaxID=2710758 RepID=A0A7S8EDE8_9CHLR|nr:RNA-binding domain-containing protein [Phototrophicus methaneseepsis]QPC84909.1 putative DNA binding domain-containing protein [Phototrophicus methaneseepsis]
MASKNATRMQWYRVDLHVHTPASMDYKDADAPYIDILRRAERRGVDIIAFTDHNTVGGYVAMMNEIERLQFLEQTGRAMADELRLLAEYRRLLDKVLVLPGFEFSATFGFHILGIFSPSTSIRYIEHVLLSLNVPPDVLERGDAAAGSTADVLEAYRLIAEAGGIAIAAHINSAHGVMMRGLNFGGQTRIAYTQDRYLHALELTDLNRRGRASTRRFFDGTKPEYPRRMHLIQGSDAHSLDTFLEGKNTRYGIGERVTEMLLRDRSFEAIKDLFASTDFSRTRPYNPDKKPYDYILAARDEGPSLVQSFHEGMERKGGKLNNVIADVCAFANTNGGTIYIGLSKDKNKPIEGIKDINDATRTLQKEISRVLTPSLDVDIDTQETQGKSIIRVLVPYGEDRPYAINDNQIYVRDEAETSLAVRDEIVNLVRQGLVFMRTEAPIEIDNGMPVPAEKLAEEPLPAEVAISEDEVTPPRAGAEIASVENRNDTRYYTIRDLRNGNIVKNVTRDSARRLWHYAIRQYEGNPVKEAKVQWYNNIGLWRRYQKAGQTRYDLVQRDNGTIRIYYGVTDSGMTGPWEMFMAPDDEDNNNN